MRPPLVRSLFVVTLLVAWLAGCSSATVPAAIATPTIVTSASSSTPTLAPTAPPTSAPATPTAVPGSPMASANVSPTALPGFPVTVTDDAGRTVTFDHPPRRIISLSPGHTETLYALGLGDEVVMTDTYSIYPAENKPKARLNTFPKPNVEEIVSLRPDLVVVLIEGNDFIQQMDARHIAVLKIFPASFAGTLKDIELLGRVTGTEARAQQITRDMQSRANAVTARTKDAPKPRVLYELDASDPTKPFVAGSGGFYGDLVPMAGGTNVFADIKEPAAQVSAEQIIARDPQIILLADATSPYNAQTPAMVKARPGWSEISAVRSGKIYPVDGDLLTRPGPRLADGLEALAKIIHPELFK